MKEVCNAQKIEILFLTIKNTSFINILMFNRLFKKGYFCYHEIENLQSLFSKNVQKSTDSVLCVLCNLFHEYCIIKYLFCHTLNILHEKILFFYFF